MDILQNMHLDDFLKNVKAWGVCEEKCKTHESCIAWNYQLKGKYYQEPKYCKLYSDFFSITSDEYFVTGFKECESIKTICPFKGRC